MSDAVIDPPAIAKTLAEPEKQALLWFPPNDNARDRGVLAKRLAGAVIPPQKSVLERLRAFPIAPHIDARLCAPVPHRDVNDSDEHWSLTWLGQNVRAALAGERAAAELEAERKAREDRVDAASSPYADAIAGDMNHPHAKTLLWFPPNLTWQHEDTRDGAYALVLADSHRARLENLACFPTLQGEAALVVQGDADRRMWRLTPLGFQVRKRLEAMSVPKGQLLSEEVGRLLMGDALAASETAATAIAQVFQAPEPPSLEAVMDEVHDEVERAESLHPPLNSAHEGWAVISEEFNKELWEHVCTNEKRRDVAAMRKEAVEVAAMAVRFIRDVCDGGRGSR